MRRVLALVLALLAGPAHAEDAAALAATANGFYAAYAAIRPAGLPDAAGRARLAPYLTARLNKALAEAAGADARFRAQHKAAPALIEGDVFTALFDGATAWKLGACRIEGQTGRCAVGLTHQQPGQKPVSWTDTLIFRQAGGWKIDDVIYDPALASGNTGTLGALLSMTLSEVP